MIDETRLSPVRIVGAACALLATVVGLYAFSLRLDTGEYPAFDLAPPAISTHE